MKDNPETILKQAIFDINCLDEKPEELVDRLWDLVNEIEGLSD